MPWTARDASRFTGKANDGALRTLWARIANSVLAQSGDEGKAIRVANTAVGRARRKKDRK